MKITTLILCIIGVFCAGCAETPKPTKQLVAAQVAMHSANEAGANTLPQAQLHNKLAAEQLKRAEELIEEGENEAATRLLSRAKADADLALAMSRKAAVERDAQQQQQGARRTASGQHANVSSP